MSMEEVAWTPKAQEMFSALCTTLTHTGREEKVTAQESSAALVALCLSFCRACGIDKDAFAESLKKSNLEVNV